MSEKFTHTADLTRDQAQVAMMTFLTCYQHAVRHIHDAEGSTAAGNFHRKIISAVKNGDVVMPLDDEAKTFQFVVAMLEGAITIAADNKDGDHKRS